MKILLASSIAPEAIARLSEDHEVVQHIGAPEAELIEAIPECHALVFRSGVSITAPVLKAGPKLELIVRAGSGYDNIDLEQLGDRLVRFVRIPGPGARAVAEMSFTLMLALGRRLLWADEEWRKGNWVKSHAGGRLLAGKTLGIVGAGNIGSTTGRLGAAWGMRVLGCVEYATEDIAVKLAADGIELTDLDRVIAESDFVSVHVPLQDSTRGLLDLERLSAMKRGAFLVNLARGGVVDEEALRSLLSSGHLAGAALDVHVREGDGSISPLADLENVILTPHIGAQTLDTQEQIGRLIEEAVAGHLREGPTTVKATPENWIVM